MKKNDEGGKQFYSMNSIRTDLIKKQESWKAL